MSSVLLAFLTRVGAEAKCCFPLALAFREGEPLPVLEVSGWGFLRTPVYVHKHSRISPETSRSHIDTRRNLLGAVARISIFRRKSEGMGDHELVGVLVRLGILHKRHEL